MLTPVCLLECTWCEWDEGESGATRRAAGVGHQLYRGQQGAIVMSLRGCYTEVQAPSCGQLLGIVVQLPIGAQGCRWRLCSREGGWLHVVAC